MRIKNILFGYFFLAILSGIVLAIWRTVMIVRYYDPYSNEYAIEAETSLRSFGFVLLFVFLALLTSAILLRKFEFDGFSASENQFSVFTSSLLGFVFLAVGIFVFFYLNNFTEIFAYPLYQCTQILTHLLVFLCAAYFILHAAGNARFENAKKMLALSTPIWSVAFLIWSYLDPTYNYRDYDHSLCLFAISALAFFLLYDAGMAVTGKSTAPYFVFSLISLVASTVYVIPNFILMAYWELSSNVNRIFEAVLLATIFYTCACLRNLCLSVKVREKTEKKKKTKKETVAQ